MTLFLVRSNNIPSNDRFSQQEESKEDGSDSDGQCFYSQVFI